MQIGAIRPGKPGRQGRGELTDPAPTNDVMPGAQRARGGSNQTGVRAYNERLALSLVRRHGALSKADLARLTGLSPQTVSVIMRSLEKDGLLVRDEPVRGRVGQPSVPMRLAADGAFSIGVKIGRRSAELVLMDFRGEIRASLAETYRWPEPQRIIAFALSAYEELTAELSERERERIAGIGVAIPFELWNWADEVGAPKGAMEAWRGIDLSRELGSRFPVPVFIENDATAACGAELVFGRGHEYSDFIYFFIGFFIGGGIVLDNALFPGRNGNAGAVGSMPVPGAEGRPTQLIDVASLHVLETELEAAGIDPSALWLSPDDWTGFGDVLERWIATTSRFLAHAIVAACSVIDFSAAIIDGGFPGEVRRRLVKATRREMTRLDLQGILTPAIIEGAAGSRARAMGGACLPLFSRYLIDLNVLFKEPA